MTDYVAHVRIQNARIRRAMRNAGIKNASELARATGLTASRVGELLNLKILPRKQNGEWLDCVLRIADALLVDPSELFSDEQLSLKLRTNTGSVEVSDRQMLRLIHQGSFPLLESPDPSAAIHTDQMTEYLTRALKTLTNREQRVLEERFTGELSYDEIGAHFDVTRERVRQIECKALQKLRVKLAGLKI